MPIGCKRDGQAQTGHQVRFSLLTQRPAERVAQVVVIGVQPPQPLHLAGAMQVRLGRLRQREEEETVAATDVCFLPASANFSRPYSRMVSNKR